MKFPSLSLPGALCCWLIGCTSVGQRADLPPTVSSVVDGPAVVAIDVRTADSGSLGFQQVTPNSTLKSNTQFALSIEVPKTSFVFVGQRSDRGPVALIYPPSAATVVRAEPGSPTVIPGPGQWFTLDEHQGEEALFFLVSTAAKEEAEVKRLLTERAEIACVKTRDPPPEGVKERDRGKSLRGPMGDDGLAVLCFPFHHR